LVKRITVSLNGLSEKIDSLISDSFYYFAECSQIKVSDIVKADFFCNADLCKALEK